MTSTDTSLTDEPAYAEVCLEASRDASRFQSFRRDPIYNRVLEHVSQEQGAAYLDVIFRSPAILARMHEFRRNDEIGDPRVFDYPRIGSVSPTTLRYVKVLADLERHFGALDAFDICEIGVGYGGQCRIISACFAPARYDLVDLDPALRLAQRFLGMFDLPVPLRFIETQELQPRSYDLVISNYAFSELRRTYQDRYLELAIRNAARGYITCNQITPPEFGSYRPEELLDRIPGARIVPEEPLTHALNCIVVWGT